MAPRQGGYRYEPDESQKRKHAWEKDYAGFESEVTGARVGKCRRSLTLEEAQGLLDEAVPYFNGRSGRPQKKHPTFLYAVDDDGVLYRARWTVKDKTMHGFPEHPDTFPMGGRGEALKSELLEMARRKGCVEELKAWMRWHEN